MLGGYIFGGMIAIMAAVWYFGNRAVRQSEELQGSSSSYCDAPVDSVGEVNDWAYNIGLFDATEDGVRRVVDLSPEDAARYNQGFADGLEQVRSRQYSTGN